MTSDPPCRRPAGRAAARPRPRQGTHPDPTATPGEYLASPESAVKFTRAAALWSALIVGFLILILLLVFIMQNTDSTTIHFFGWEWNLPVGVAILLRRRVRRPADGRGGHGEDLSAPPGGEEKPEGAASRP